MPISSFGAEKEILIDEFWTNKKITLLKLIRLTQGYNRGKYLHELDEWKERIVVNDENSYRVTWF